MKLKDQKNRCYHSDDYHYEDEDGDACCEKCDSEGKN
jgi:hypothetical protein